MDEAAEVASETAPAAAEVPMCEVCGKFPSKYCCPRCQTRSCGLECVKGAPRRVGGSIRHMHRAHEPWVRHAPQWHAIHVMPHHMLQIAAHKEQSGCTGKRDRTAFVGRGELNEKALMSGEVPAWRTVRGVPGRGVRLSHLLLSRFPLQTTGSWRKWHWLRTLPIATGPPGQPPSGGRCPGTCTPLSSKRKGWSGVQ